MKVGKKKHTPLSHWLSSHGGNVLFIYPHLNALCRGGPHFVQADALAAKVFISFLSLLGTRQPLDFSFQDSNLYVSGSHVFLQNAHAVLMQEVSVAHETNQPFHAHN